MNGGVIGFPLFQLPRTCMGTLTFGIGEIRNNPREGSRFQ
jgi:hypothetical protein